MMKLDLNSGFVSRRETVLYNCIRAVVFIILLIFIKATWNHEKYFDASYYWGAVLSFHFSRLPTLYRGYFYPYILFAMESVRRVGLSEDFLYMLFNSTMGMVMVTVIMPEVATGGNADKMSFKRKVFGTVLLLILMLLFWGDYLKYPLSDFPAMFFLGCAIYLLIRIKKIDGSGIGRKKSAVVKVVFSGIAE